MAGKPKLTDEQRSRLRARALAAPKLTTIELRAWVARELGATVSLATLYRVLPHQGLALLRNGRWREASR